MSDIIQAFPAGAGSGHTILDGDGTAMAQEKNLKIAGLDIIDSPSTESTDLAPAQLNEDSLNDVCNGFIGTNFITPSTNYSTNEQIIGKWIDGKPIYQKTVNCGALPTGSSGTLSKEVDPNIPNIKNVINIFGNAFGIYNSMYCSKPLPFVHYSENSGNVLLDFNNGKIRFISSANYSSLNAYVTLQYTKTTD